MPGLASADPHTHSTLSISRTNGQQWSNGVINPSRSMDQNNGSENVGADHRSLLHSKELSHFDAREAEESLSLYCKPIELYNIIQRRNLKNPIFLQRCLKYKIDAAQHRRMKLTIRVMKFSITPLDVTHGPGNVNGRCINQENASSEQVFQPVLVMLTTPISTSGMGYSCFRLGHTRVLRTTPGNIATADNKGQSSVTFLLPEIQKLILNAKRDGSTFVFISSVDLNNGYAGKVAQIGASGLGNSNGSVLWGSMPLTALCQNWLDANREGNHQGFSPETPGVMIHVDLYPSRLQLVNSTKEGYVSFQSVPFLSGCKCKATLELYVSRDELGKDNDDIPCGTGTGRTLNHSSSLHGWRLQPGQVVFHYYYYFNRLYKAEVTEKYSCPFCVRHCCSLKGLRCHLISSHDLFTFEFIASVDYRLINVFCRNDVLGPEGNVRDIDGLNDPRLKHFVYWSKRGRPRKLTPSLNNFERQSILSIPSGTPALHECLPKYPSSTLHASSAKNKLVNVDVKVSKDRPLLAQRFEESSSCQLLSDHLPRAISYSSSPKIDNNRDVQVNIEPRKRGRPDMKAWKLTDHALQALKMQRSEGCSVSDSHSQSAFSQNLVGSGPNGVCLAIAAPMPTNKGKLKRATKAQVISRMEKYQKVIAERNEPRLKSQLMKRQFFHSHTAQPMAVEQLHSDRDSEDENDDEIVDLEDRRMLDDFVDVTPYEKEFMHLWNSFVRKQRLLADGHCPWGCEAFAKLHMKKFNSNPSLRRCLMLFLIKLWNHNLVDGNTMNRCLLIVDSFMETSMALESKTKPSDILG